MHHWSVKVLRTQNTELVLRSVSGPDYPNGKNGSGAVTTMRAKSDPRLPVILPCRLCTRTIIRFSPQSWQEKSKECNAPGGRGLNSYC